MHETEIAGAKIASDCGSPLASVWSDSAGQQTYWMSASNTQATHCPATPGSAHGVPGQADNALKTTADLCYQFASNPAAPTAVASGTAAVVSPAAASSMVSGGGNSDNHCYQQGPFGDLAATGESLEDCSIDVACDILLGNDVSDLFDDHTGMLHPCRPADQNQFAKQGYPYTAPEHGAMHQTSGVAADGDNAADNSRAAPLAHDFQGFELPPVLPGQSIAGVTATLT